MKTIRLRHGTDELTLDPVGFGLALFNDPDPDDLFPVLDLFRERSRTFDSARIYGNLLQTGRGGSDALLGRYLKSRGIANEAVVITKGGHPSIARMTGDRLDAKNLRKDLEQSLRFLQRETVDVYFLHRDSGRDVADVMATLDGFVRQGMVRFLGASNWTMARILEANAFAAANGLAPFSIGQIQDSYATLAKPPRDGTIVVADAAERERYARSGLPYMAFTSQARGWFAKRDSGTLGAHDDYAGPENERRYAVLRRLADKYGAPVAALALKPLVDAKAAILPIITSMDRAHLVETLKVYDFEVEPEDLRALMQA